jgi:hypothetical protein
MLGIFNGGDAAGDDGGGETEKCCVTKDHDPLDLAISDRPVRLNARHGLSRNRMVTLTDDHEKANVANDFYG